MFLDKGERGDDNETSLKEGGGIEMSTTVLHSRAAPSLENIPSWLRFETVLLNYQAILVDLHTRDSL